MTGPPPSMPARFELPARTASGVVLALAAVAAVIGGGLMFAVIVAGGAIAGLREWHRLVSPTRFLHELVPTSLAMVAVVWFARQPDGLVPAIMAIAAGAAGAALMSSLHRPARPWPIPWHGFGGLYLGFPALALILLRGESHGALLVGALFVAVWTADTGALLFGRLIGGAKLAPRLSPNKTWAGFLCGTMAAGAAEAVYVGILGDAILPGAIFGIFLALAGHCGDLFESWVKRQFDAKNTGRLIPGHGGMLDRIDSLLFAAPACAILVIFAGFDPLQGMRP